MPKPKTSRPTKWLRISATVLFLVGLLWIGVLATGSAMTFGWAGYGVIGAGAVLGLSWWRHPSSAPGLVRCLSMIAFCGYIVWRAAVSPVEYLARSDQVLVMAAVVAYAAGLTLWPQRRGRSAVLLMLVALLAGNFVFAALQSKSMPWLHVLNSIGFSRPVGDPSVGGFYILGNHLSGFLEIISFLLLGIGCFGRLKIGWRLFCFFGFVICGIALAIAVSRGGTLSFGIGFGVFVVLGIGVVLVRFRGRFGLWSWIFSIGAVGAVAALIFALNSEFLMQHFRGQFLKQRDFREELWKVAWEQYEESPYIGTGSNSFEYYVRKRIPATFAFLIYSGSPEPEFAHNEYLQLLGDYGGVGFALGLLTIVAHGVGGLRDVFSKNRSDDLALGNLSDRLGLTVAGLAIVAAYGAHAFLDFNLHIPANAVFFALALATLNLPRPRGADSRTRVLPSLSSRIALRSTLVVGALAGSWLVTGAFRYAPSEYHVMRGQSLESSGETIRAAYHYGEAATRDPACYRAFLGQGYTRRLAAVNEEIPLLVRSWNIQALEAYDQARLLYPQNAYVYNSLGDTLSELAAFDDADREFKRALALAPNHRDFWITYARHLTRKGDFKGARDAFKKAFSLHWWDDDRKEANGWVRVLEKAIREQE